MKEQQLFLEFEPDDRYGKKHTPHYKVNGIYILKKEWNNFTAGEVIRRLFKDLK